MGGAKPLADLGGRPLVAWPLAAAADASLEAVVVAKAATALPPGLPVWHEPAEPVHPLLGLVHALERAGRPVLAVACDMPWVPGALLARLAAGPAAAVPRSPFPARYEPADLPALRAALARQDGLRRTLAALAPAVLDEAELAALGDPAVLLASVNTPAELAAARRRVGSRA
jgi:molybdopterin-guanine dinucleotide biosynthesis protein A